MPGTKDFFVEIGDEVTYSKTVGESDVYLFAGITGDLSSNHVNEQVMKESSFGQRIAHGALLVGFMSTTSTMMIEMSQQGGRGKGLDAGFARLRRNPLCRTGLHPRHDYGYLSDRFARTRTQSFGCPTLP